VVEVVVAAVVEMAEGFVTQTQANKACNFGVMSLIKSTSNISSSVAGTKRCCWVR